MNPRGWYEFTGWRSLWTLLVENERVAIEFNGQFWLVCPEWIWEFATQNYWLRPTFEFYFR
jgi:hypothetical protein